MSDQTAHTERIARELMDKAYEYLGTNDAGRAKKLGKKLLKMRFSGGYEVLARAYELENRLDAAIAVLEEGVQTVPQVWLLWQLLGNYYSDDGDFVKAEHVYNQALTCPGVDVSSVNFNKSIALHRQGRSDEAMDALDQVDSEALHWPGLALRVAILNGQGHFNKASDLAKHLIERILESEELFDRYTVELAGLLTELGLSIWRSEDDPETAKGCFLQALRYVKNFPYALAMLRQAKNETSPNSKLFHLMVLGHWYEPLEEGSNKSPKFYSFFECVADTPEEALEQARELEPEQVRNSLVIEEYKEISPYADNLKGVYSRSGYTFFEEEA
ncbi:MAG TPA: hypothetical protein V6D17_24860 [Candidatus Obscuribacterales bacterium]